MMLNADVRKGGRGLVKFGHPRTGGREGYEKGIIFLQTSFMDDPLGDICSIDTRVLILGKFLSSLPVRLQRAASRAEKNGAQ